MTLYEHDIGTGGDFATLALWQADRAGAGAVSGDTERANLLDGTYAASAGLAVSATWATGVNLEICGKNPHLNDWSVTAQGAKISYASETTWITLGGTVHLTVRNLVIDGNNVGGWPTAIGIGGWGATDRTLRLEKCLLQRMFRGVNNEASSSTRTLNLYADACVFRNIATGGDNAAIHVNSWSGGIHTRVVATLRGCTFANAGVRYARASSSASLTLEVVGCLVSPTTATTFLTVAGSSGALTATSIDNIGPATAAAHETNFTSGPTNYTQAAWVTGTPGVGEVGFTDISGGDYSLVDHANNVAIDYVVNGSVESYDALGNPRDATPDCGAFEVQTVAGDVSLTPAPAQYEFTTPAPTVTRTEHVTLAPAPASYEFSGPVPSVTVTDHVTLAPAPALYEFNRPAPLVVLTDHVTLAPAPAYYEFANPVPAVTVGAGIVLTPGPASYEFSRPVALVGITDHITLTPAAARYEFSGPAPLVLAGGLPTVTAGIWSVPVRLAAGDEWMLVATGPAADAPRMRVTMRFRE